MTAAPREPGSRAGSGPAAGTSGGSAGRPSLPGRPVPPLRAALLPGRIARTLRRDVALHRFLDTLARAVRNRGGSLYLAGGFARDLCEGRARRDADLLVAGVPFGELGRLLRGLPAARLGIRRIVAAGKHFPVHRIRTGWSDREIDVAASRGVAEEPPDRPAPRPHREAIRDAARRDFTINSVMIAVETSRGVLRPEVVDPFRGLSDLSRGIVRAVRDPAARFREDPLRILRAIRMKRERPGFRIERGTWRAIRELSPALLPSLSPDRVAPELLRSLAADPEGTVSDLARAGILDRILPEIRASGKGAVAGIRKRYGLLRDFSRGPLPPALLAANLLLDVAVRESKSAGDPFPPRLPLANAALRRLRFPRPGEPARILSGVVSLLRFRSLPHPLARVESILSRRPDPEPVLALYEAFRKARGLPHRDFRPFLRTASRRPPLLAGGDVVRLGIAAGPRVEEILAAVRDATLAGKVRSREEAARMAARLGGVSPRGSR